MLEFYEKIYDFGDKLEDKVRGKLSRYPIIYAFIGGTGVVIFWRGVWHTADFLMEYYFASPVSPSSTSGIALPWWDGPLFIIIGSAILLLTGLLVSSFVGNEIIITGIKGERRMAEKTEKEIKEDIITDAKEMSEIRKISNHLEEIEKALKIKS
jgi:hypothetical protein